MPPRVLITLLLGGLAGFFLQREQTRGTFAPLDQGHVAWLLANRGVAAPAQMPQVILARLDDADHAEGERQFEAWPPTALEWAGLLEEMALLHPRTVALGSTNGWASQEPELLLEKACHALPGLLLGTTAEGQGTAEGEPGPGLLHVVGDVSALPSYQVVAGQARLTQLGNCALTQVNLSEHPAAKPTIIDGVLLLPLLFRQDAQVQPALALQALLSAAQVSPEQIQVQLGEAITWPGGGHIAIDAAGRFVLPLWPINEQPLPVLNLDTLKMDAAQRERFLTQDDPVRRVLPQVEGALVWAGEDDRVARRFPLPDGRRLSLAELTARALQAMQTGRAVAMQSQVWQLLTLAFVLAAAAWRSTGRWCLLGVLGLGLASLLMIQSANVWMPVGPGLVLLGIGWFVNLLVPAGKPS